MQQSEKDNCTRNTRTRIVGGKRIMTERGKKNEIKERNHKSKKRGV